MTEMTLRSTLGWWAGALSYVLPATAFANCVLQPGGTVVICDATSPAIFGSSISANPPAPPPAGTIFIPTNGATVTILAGSGLATTGAAVQVRNNSTVVNAGSITTTFLNAYGIWSGDPNNATSTTAGFGNILRNEGSIVTNQANSVGLFGRTYNTTFGNTLINTGTIETRASISGVSARASSAGIRSESVAASTIINSGTVTARGAFASIGAFGIGGNGVEMAGPGSFTNQAGGVVTSVNAYGFYGNGLNASGITVDNAGTIQGGRGAILFGAGLSDNTVILRAGSTTIGTIDGGTGSIQSRLVFDGLNAPGFTNALPNWQTIALQNGAVVTLGATTLATNALTIEAGSRATVTADQATIPGTIRNDGMLTFASASDLTIAAAMTGSGALAQSGAGALTLSGPGSWTGPTEVASGMLRAGAPAAFSPASTFTVAAGATLDLANLPQTIGALAGAGNVTTGTAQLTTGGNGASTLFGGVISGSGGLVKEGAGAFVLAGPNTYLGGTTINAGTLQLGNGGTSGSIQGDVTNNATLAFNRSDASVFSGVISGTGGIGQMGTGTTILTGDNSFTGGTTISAGTLRLGNGGTSGSIMGNVVNNAALVFNRADTIVFPGTISGTGSVMQNGPGAVTLTGANTYLGDTWVNGGSLRAGASGTFSAASVHRVASGAGLALDGLDQTIAGLANAGLVTFGTRPGTTLTVAGAYVGNGGTLGMNTVLGGDGSLTDRLVIQGGNATGTTALRIANAGGTGALTGSEGIRLVQASNGATTAPGAFTLAGRVAAGAFE